MLNKRCAVCGAGGFIGNHLVDRLKALGAFVVGIDIRPPPYCRSKADEFMLLDLRDPSSMPAALAEHPRLDWVFQLAADMGGAEFVFTGGNDSAIMRNSAAININALSAMTSGSVPRVGGVFFSSSACMYPYHGTFQRYREDEAYPAMPDSEYGWEKLFSERMYFAHMRNVGLNVKVARFHNVFGPLCSWNDGREKSIAAICRKVAECEDGGTVDVFGDGKQCRSYLHVDDCIDGVLSLCGSGFCGPVNLGSEESISVDGLVRMVAGIAGKDVSINHVEGPVGVCGRNSDSTCARSRLGWVPKVGLVEGLSSTYRWVESMVEASR